MQKIFVTIFVVLVIVVGISFADASAQPGTCWVTGDVNGDGIPLTVGGDLIPIIRFVEYGVPLPDSLFKADLNGDCVIDAGDAELCQCYFVYGLSCFRNPFPFTTCCSPDTVRGACRGTLDSCAVRSEANCLAHGGTYHGSLSRCGIAGDANGDQIINISDAAYLVAYIFAGGAPPYGLISGDTDCNGAVNITDAVRLIGYIFGSLPTLCGKCTS